MDQLPDSLPPVHRPLSVCFAAAANNSEKRAFRTCGKSADQLPEYSVSRLSAVACHTPFQPVEYLSALQVPRIAVTPFAPLNVQPPEALSLVEFGATVQVPAKMRPSDVRALQVEEPGSLSRKDSLASLLITTSIARTQPIKPCLVRTIYQTWLPTDSAIETSVSSFSKVAMWSVSASCRAYNATPVARAVSTEADSAAWIVLFGISQIRSAIANAKRKAVQFILLSSVEMMRTNPLALIIIHFEPG